MQAKYVIISQYWKQVVVKSNDLLRLPSRLWGLLNVTELIHLLPPKCFFPPFRNCDSGHSAEDIFYMISCLWNFIKVLIHSYLLEAGKKKWSLDSSQYFFFLLSVLAMAVNCVPFVQIQLLLVNDICSEKLLQKFLHKFYSFWMSLTVIQKISFL